MATIIEPGLTLKGDDARRFHEYLENPTYTPEAKQLIKRAAQRAKHRKL